MGKKRAVPRAEAEGLADVAIRQLQEAELASGIKGEYVCDAARQLDIGVPLVPFSLQWLYHNNAFAMGRMTIHIGESGSCKTSLLFETMRWHLEHDLKGGAWYHHTEAREMGELQNGLLGACSPRVWRPRKEDDPSKEERLDTIEKWQYVTTRRIQWLKDTFARKGGVANPCVVGVDSMTGVTSQEVTEKIEEDGFASRTWAPDSMLLNSYLKWVPSKVADHPLSLVCVNHIKFDKERRGAFVQKIPRIPGGDAIKYCATVVILCKYKGDVDRDDVSGGHKLVLETFKNSLGERNKALPVEFVWRQKGQRKTFHWEWDEATINLLKIHLGLSKDHPHLGDLIDFPVHQGTARKCNCPQVGITKPTPFDEVGKAIAADASLMGKLRDYYGIHTMPLFQSGVPWLKQKAAALQSGFRAYIENAAPMEDLPAEPAAEGDAHEPGG